MCSLETRPPNRAKYVGTEKGTKWDGTNFGLGGNAQSAWPGASQRGKERRGGTEQLNVVVTLSTTSVSEQRLRSEMPTYEPFLLPARPRSAEGPLNSRIRHRCAYCLPRGYWAFQGNSHVATYVLLTSKNVNLYSSKKVGLTVGIERKMRRLFKDRVKGKLSERTSGVKVFV